MLHHTNALLLTSPPLPPSLPPSLPPLPPSTPSHRAANFFVLNSHQLGQWFQSIGLDMYSGIIERSVPSGQRLVEMVEASTNNDLVVSLFM